MLGPSVLGVCMFSRHLPGFFQLFPKNMHNRLTGDSKLTMDVQYLLKKHYINVSVYKCSLVETEKSNFVNIISKSKTFCAKLYLKFQVCPCEHVQLCGKS